MPALPCGHQLPHAPVWRVQTPYGICHHCLRHGYAIHKIALAIKQGAIGDAYLLIDAEGHQRFPHNADNVPALPTWVCPFTHSKPDITFFPFITTCILQNDCRLGALHSAPITQ